MQGVSLASLFMALAAGLEDTDCGTMRKRLGNGILSARLPSVLWDTWHKANLDFCRAQATMFLETTKSAGLMLFVCSQQDYCVKFMCVAAVITRGKLTYLLLLDIGATSLKMCHLPISHMCFMKYSAQSLG